MLKTYTDNKITFDTGEIYRVEDIVYKVNPSRLGEEWRRKAEKIFNIWTPSTFIDFIDNGYKTKYIEGYDLHGNPSFTSHDNSKDFICILSNDEKYKVLEIFREVIEVGQMLGFTLGDITCGNILKEEDLLYLIDYDVIIDYPPNHTYSTLWSNTLNIAFGK